MKKDYVWQDVNGNKYELKDIDDKYLLNILRFIKNGGGYIAFLDDEKIEKLYNEAIRRKLKIKYKLKMLIDAFHEKLYFWACEPDW